MSLPPPDTTSSPPREMIGILWYLLGSMSGVLVSLATTEQIHQYYGKVWESVARLSLIFFVAFYNTRTYVKCRHMPKRPIGRHAKLALSVGTLFAVILPRLFMDYNVLHLVFVVSFNLQLLAIWKLQHGVTDINLCEALMGSLMQIATYQTFDEPIVFFAVLLVSAALIFSRYLFYSFPIALPRSSPNMENLESG